MIAKLNSNVVTGKRYTLILTPRIYVKIVYFHG